ncbi:nuclear transport factor 2 family protein [Siccirubricoccus sp. KC 17139]|uniref:Nuclear transport factor 2 family protein n=1 Tax=Siccirubricoccus soli TaxID=2899147 RepID=A0ABT1D9S3_9PROT|nr:ketosteroid isomerase-related protein [Siccirubricoccus soli]MCO6418687.1 nuclear transport factor 2 family protein [Siccirubricoccus soli]MCP2684822.1 nuclear transport factor 2 family protein [Siccirubricoccus soli]
MTETERLIRAYYAAFAAGDRAGMLALLAEDVAHDVNQGARQTGKPAFAAFMVHMDRCYREVLRDLVVMVDSSGRRAAAEFIVEGEYLATDAGLPEARGQRYTLPAGAFFEVKGGKIARVTVYYNLPEWIRQVSG